MILFAQTYFSLFQSTLSPEKIFQIACEKNYTSICICDTNSMAAYPALYRLQKKRYSQIRLIIGALITCDECEAILIPRTSSAYHHINQLISIPSLRKEGLENISDDFISITHQEALAMYWLHRQKSFFWQYFLFSSLAPKPIRQHSSFQPIAAHLFQGLPGDEDTLHLLKQIQVNQLFQSATKKIPEVPDPDTYEAMYSPYHNAYPNLRFLLNSKTYLYQPQMVFPQYSQNNVTDTSDLLRSIAYQGALKRYQIITPIIKDRLDYELKIIKQKSFSDYFLIVWQIVQQASRTCGRGSGSASVVSYCLFITNIDPIRYRLLFERFLEPNRQDYPDLDIDFAWDERDQILDYVFHTFGHQHTAMICNHIYFQPKMAFRETAKAHGLSQEKITRLSPRIRDFIKRNRHKLHQTPSYLQRILYLSMKILHVPRHYSVHCGGIVITPQPIHHYSPTLMTLKGVPIIQREKGGSEEMGLVKIDLLGNRSLAVIRDTLHNIEENHMVCDFHRTDPTLDAATQEILAKGESMGVFYIESPATRLLQRRTQKGDFEHIVIHSSLIHPASNDSIREYTRRVLAGNYTPIHPHFREITSDTYGILVYEDQVLRTVHELAGFTYHEANQLCKALSRDDKISIKSFKDQFMKGGLSAISDSHCG